MDITNSPNRRIDFGQFYQQATTSRTCRMIESWMLFTFNSNDGWGKWQAHTSIFGWYFNGHELEQQAEWITCPWREATRGIWSISKQQRQQQQQSSELTPLSKRALRTSLSNILFSSISETLGRMIELANLDTTFHGIKRYEIEKHERGDHAYPTRESLFLLRYSDSENSNVWSADTDALIHLNTSDD